MRQKTSICNFFTQLASGFCDLLSNFQLVCQIIGRKIMDLVMKPSSYTSSSGLRKAGGVVSYQFPAGLRVLVVDDDPTCLRILEKMLMNCLYEVTTCNRAEVALQFLRDNKNGYDIVISDVHMPDMDGFKLLEHIGLEMDLPVIMMSADDSKHVVMKGVTHGACDYLIKPVRMEALKNMWQHVVRKKKHEWKDRDFEPSASAENGERLQKLSPDDLDLSPSANEGNWKNSKKRKDDEEDADERDETSTLKKPRVVWSVELHQQFVNAVNHLGIDKAVPKKILELMNVPGLTRENVASHLQKYRLYLRRLSGVSQHQNGLNNSFMGSPDMTFGPLSSLNSIDLQALAASGQIPPQSLATIQAASFGQANTKTTLPGPLVDQRNIFCFENPKLRYVEGGQQNNQSTKQLNLLHGIPTNMDSKQLASLHQSAQSFGNVNLRAETQKSQSSSLLTPIVQTLRPPPQILNNVNRSHGSDNGHSSVRQSVLSQAIPDLSLLSQSGGIESFCGLSSYNSIPKPSTVVDFSRTQNLEFSGNNSFAPSLTNFGTSNLTCKLQDEAVKSNVKGSTSSFLPSYDVFGDLNHIKAQDWPLPNNGSSSENLNVRGGSNVSPSMLTQTGFSSNQNNGLLSISSSDRTTFSASEGLGNNPIIDHPINSSSISDNSLRIKAERLPDMGFQSGLFNEHYGQDDLMSAMLKQQQTMAPSDREFGFDGYHVDNLAV